MSEMQERKPGWVKVHLNPKRIWRWLRLHPVPILLIVVCVLLAILLFGNGNKANYSSRSIDFGLTDIGEFATQAGYYTNVNVIDKPDRTIAGVPIPGTSSKAIMTYQGTIRAGLDFDLVEMAVDNEKKIVTFKMPAVRILSNEVDLESCEVLDINNSVFNKIDVIEYNQSLVEMKDKAETQAIENHILVSAKTNAEILIRSMFENSAGGEDYEIRFQWPEG